jgi:hypothetical protein
MHGFVVRTTEEALAWVNRDAEGNPVTDDGGAEPLTYGTASAPRNVSNRLRRMVGLSRKRHNSHDLSLKEQYHLSRAANEYAVDEGWEYQLSPLAGDVEELRGGQGY